MKHLLLASSALVAMTGFAAAEVTVGGDGRMGVRYNNIDDAWEFSSRIRISFTASGETDGGLAFGGSIRAGNSGNGESGAAGNVYISGGFGKIAMGDVDSAAEAAVGQVSGVGFTGLGDLNELYFGYIGEGADTSASAVESRDPVLLYTGTFGDATVYASLSDNVDGSDSYGVGISYNFGDYTVSAGYEHGSNFTLDTGVFGLGSAAVGDVDMLVVGAKASFGDATIKAIYASYDLELFSNSPSEYALSIDYKFGMATVTAFYSVADIDDPAVSANYERYGLGGSYDLGGGASLVGGVVKTNEVINAAGDEFMAADFGIKMSF